MASTGDVPILLMLVLCLYHRTVCTVLVPLVQCSGIASTGNVPSYSRLHRVYCACTLCTVICHGQHGQCTYFYPCLYSSCGCTIAQCVLCLYLLYSVLAWPARVMYILPVFVLVLCVYHCTVCTVRVSLVQWFSMASTSSVPI